MGEVRGGRYFYCLVTCVLGANREGMGQGQHLGEPGSSLEDARSCLHCTVLFGAFVPLKTRLSFPFGVLTFILVERVEVCRALPPALTTAPSGPESKALVEFLALTPPLTLLTS